MSDPEQTEPEESTVRELEFHFLKSNFFRVIHVDGVWGGTSPTGLIQMAVYSQRSPLPKVVKEKVRVEGDTATKIGEGTREGRSGIIREVEADLLMSLETASALRDWLETHIQRIKNQRDSDDDEKDTVST